MMLVPLQIAAALTLPTDLGARPGPASALGAARTTLMGLAGVADDVSLGGQVDLGVGVGLGLELTGSVHGAGTLVGGGAESGGAEPEPSGHPLPACDLPSVRSRAVGAVAADPVEEARRRSRVGLRWTIPNQTLAVQADVIPAGAGGELRLHAWRSVGRRMIVTGFGGWRVVDDDGAATWGAAAQIPVATSLSAVFGVEGAALTDEGETGRLVAGARLAVGPVDVLAMGSHEVVSESAWIVGVGVTFHLGRSPAATPPPARPEPEPRRVLVIMPDEEVFGDPAADDDRVGADVVEDREVSVTREADELILGEPVFFAKDRRRVRRAFLPPLSALAAYLHEHPEITRLQIHGHADPTGPDDWNERLSEARARSVAAILVEHGIDAGRLEPLGVGARSPWVSNDTEEGRARNRRVVFVVGR